MDLRRHRTVDHDLIRTIVQNQRIAQISVSLAPHTRQLYVAWWKAVIDDALIEMHGDLSAGTLSIDDYYELVALFDAILDAAEHCTTPT